MEKMERMATEEEIYLRINNLFFCKQSPAKMQLILTCVGQACQNRLLGELCVCQGTGLPFAFIGLIGARSQHLNLVRRLPFLQ